MGKSTEGKAKSSNIHSTLNLPICVAFFLPCDSNFVFRIPRVHVHHRVCSRSFVGKSTKEFQERELLVK